MSLLTLFNYPEELTFDTRDTRVVGSSTSVRTQDLKLSGGLLAVANYDMRISGQVGPLGYVGPLGTASSSTSSTSLALTSSFVNAGRHVILIIAHSSGGNVTGASDPRGNTWTVDEPSQFNDTTAISIVSAPITTSLQAGDLITVTWSAAVVQKAISGEVFQGIRQTGYVDKTAANSGLSFSINTGTTATTASANQLILGGIAIATGSVSMDFIPGASLTELATTNSAPGNPNNRMSAGAFKIVAVIGTYNVTGTLT